ncbi:MgtC/SapB family protein [Rhodomicrobium sp. Az07]|uniref:MgtC/SapB family protein n=1 Tax=Rhodomicrobium sp. Az07 TaxID=2839034 RepID=UPI001BE75DAD|nr:MgtC/SapB family protein [Rhodomicrobium sp. Az07]MBT3069515.1 MgtC/SapB family protein [Rhodomicrobium sp. Az07]
MHTFAAYATSFVLATLIGLERQWRQRSAGLRTVALVAVGAAAFADLGFRVMGPEGVTRIVSYIVSGIGFLGAGVILKDGTNIRGLNTAATLWCSAAVGALAGAGLLIEAGTLTLFVLAGNTLLRPLVNWVNRRPITAEATEAEYALHVVCEAKNVSDVRELIASVLAKASYPVREVEARPEASGLVELDAILLPTDAESAELDAVVAALEQSPLVSSAAWSVEATS